MTPPRELLYNLLPAVYRNRDYYQGEPLRALMGVLELVFDQLESSIARSSDNWFIETCPVEFIPLIADLVGLPRQNSPATVAATDRAHVGNAIAYRRRKGTLPALERAVTAATGWYARALEYRELLSTAQPVNDPDISMGRTADLRDTEALERLDGPFESTAHLVSVRRAGRRQTHLEADTPVARGKYNIPAVGIFLWRLQAQLVTRAAARKIRNACFTVHPFGIDTPLFNQPDCLHSPEARTQPVNVPAPLTRAALALNLKNRAAERRAIQLWAREPQREAFHPVSGARLRVANLTNWLEAPAAEDAVFVDPELGRIQFADAAAAEAIEVTYSFGFSADIGGGPQRTLQDLPLPPDSVWQAVVLSPPRRPYDTEVNYYRTLQEAAAAWATDPDARDKDGLILIADSSIYFGSLDIQLAGRSLDIRAFEGECPAIIGDLRVSGAARAAAFTVHGVRLDGALRLEGRLSATVHQCTIGPPRLGADARAAIVAHESGDAGAVEVSIRRSIVGPIELDGGAAVLDLRDSIVDGGPGYAIRGHRQSWGPQTRVEGCTIFGPASFEGLDLASTSIFTGLVAVQERNLGCVRFSYVPPDSVVPPRYRTVPDGVPPPFFTARHYGQPGYAQLGLNCPPEYFKAAADGGEIGVFHLLRQHQRMSRLAYALEEFVPIGLSPAVFYET